MTTPEEEMAGVLIRLQPLLTSDDYNAVINAWNTYCAQKRSRPTFVDLSAGNRPTWAPVEVPQKSGTAVVGPPPQRHLGQCKQCARAILWAKGDLDGHWIPLDPTPEDGGECVLYVGTDGSLIASANMVPLDPGYDSHRHTCPKRLPEGYLMEGCEYLAEVKEVEQMGGIVHFTFLVNCDGLEQECHGRVPARSSTSGSELRRWLEFLLERPLEKGEKLDTSVLIGKSCCVRIGKRQKVLDVVAGDVAKKLQAIVDKAKQ